jgi:transcriptional regulator with XRE-family HTH domain
MDKDALKKFRESIGLTQSGLADALSVANNTISRWELGTRAIPEFLPLALETIERRQKAKNAPADKPQASFVLRESVKGESVKETTKKPVESLDNEHILTVKDVAKIVDRSPRQVRTYAGSGELKGKHGKQDHWFFRQIDVDEYLKSRSRNG